MLRTAGKKVNRPEMEFIPDSRDLVAQYLLLYSFSGDPDDFDEVVDYDYQHANVAFFLRSDHSQDIERVVHQIRDFALREFGHIDHNGGVSEAEADPLSVRFGGWLAGIEPTIRGWETASGFRLGLAGAVVVVGGFMVFLASNFTTNFYLGAMLALNMSACLVAAMTVLPAILNRWIPCRSQSAASESAGQRRRSIPGRRQ